MSLNHPCKELIWVIQPDANVAANRQADYTDGSVAYLGKDTLLNAKLQLNGHDRFAVRDATYFNVVDFATKSIDVGYSYINCQC